MEKRLLLFLVLTFGMIFLYYSLFPAPKPPEKPEGPAVPVGPATGTGAAEVPAPPKPVVPPSPEAAAPEGEAGIPARVAAGAGAATTIDTPRARFTVDTWGGGIRVVSLKEFARLPGQDLESGENWFPVISDRTSASIYGKAAASYRRRSLTVDVLDASGEVAINLSEVLWALAEREADRVLFRLDVPAAGVVLEKELRFPSAMDGSGAGAYHAKLTFRVRVTDAARAARFGAGSWTFRLTGPGGIPADPNTPSGMGNVAAVLTRETVSPEEIHVELDEGRKEWPEAGDQGPERLVEWAGMHGRFFAAILRPENPAQLGATRAVIEAVEDRDERDQKIANLAVALDFSMKLPAEGATEVRTFLFYAGPMDPDVFSAEPYSAFEPIIDYGWFGFIAKILVFLLGVLHSVLGNWGVAIIVLTLLVRMAMFPLSRKQQVSMQRYQKQMARLKPKMDAIRERHAKNKKKVNEEIMKLYREEGVRMFPAGCLVMFLQLPIFIGLFQALRYSIGLRHSAFLWVKDLTAPDQLAGPFRTTGIPLVPDPFSLNLLPILMGFTWWLSTALQPKPSDPQQAQQMKMMQWMPIVFSLLLYSYPAGLALYMVVSSTWSIFETKVVKKLLAKE